MITKTRKRVGSVLSAIVGFFLGFLGTTVSGPFEAAEASSGEVTISSDNIVRIEFAPDCQGFHFNPRCLGFHLTSTTDVAGESLREVTAAGPVPVSFEPRCLGFHIQTPSEEER